jgi:hypothetical protein
MNFRSLKIALLALAGVAFAFNLNAAVAGSDDSAATATTHETQAHAPRATLKKHAKHHHRHHRRAHHAAAQTPAA